jgi:hypothetical protein
MGRKSQSTVDSGDDRFIETFKKSLRLSLSMLSFILKKAAEELGESKIKNDKKNMRVLFEGMNERITDQNFLVTRNRIAFPTK